MVDIDEIADALATLPAVVRSLLAPYDRAALTARPAPGEWCALEVIGHLITCDTGAFRDRIVSIAGGTAEVPPFDGAAALAGRDPTTADVDELLDELEAVRAASVAFVRSLQAAELEATAPYRDHGTFAASDFLLEWPHHDLEHLGQIADALRRRYLEPMTVTMRTALETS